MTAPRLAWEACFKKTRVELELLTDIHMLLMVENGISQGEVEFFKQHIGMLKQTINIWMIMIKTLNHHT